MSAEVEVETASPRLSCPGACAALLSIVALVLREMATRYGRRPGGYAWALLQPLGMIVLLAFAWSLLMRSPTLGTSFLLFKATGILVLQTYTTLANAVGQAMSYSRALLFYPRVTWIDAVIARFLLNTLVIWAVSTLILGGILLYDNVRTVLDWGQILLAMGLATGLGLGSGCLNCFLFQRFPVWQNIWGIVTAPLFLISGVLFVYEDLPPLAQTILWYNPILHVTGIMRDGFYPVYSPGYVSLPFVGACILLPMAAGLLLLRQFHRDLLNR